MVIVAFGQHELSLCQCDTFVSGIIGVQAYTDERERGQVYLHHCEVFCAEGIPQLINCLGAAA